MDHFIILTQQQLQALVEGAVHKVLDEREKRAQKSDDGPMDVSEAAIYLKLSVSTLYRYTSNRLIPHDNTGKKLYFYKNKLDEWLQDHKKMTKKQIEEAGCIPNLLTHKRKYS